MNQVSFLKWISIGTIRLFSAGRAPRRCTNVPTYAFEFSDLRGDDVDRKSLRNFDQRRHFTVTTDDPTCNDAPSLQRQVPRREEGL